MTHRRLLVPFCAAVAILTAGTAGWAFWTQPGTGAATVITASLDAPADVTVPATSTGTVHVTWTAAALTAGDRDADGYYVRRVGTSDGVSAAACGTSASAPATSAACDDLGVPDGGYRYLVTAVYGSWTAVSEPSAVVAVTNDDTPPTVALTFPTDGTFVNADDWASGCPAPGVCGTAGDPSGVASVAVSVRQNSTGLYWTGTDFAHSAETFVTATGTTTWTLPVPRPADGSYTVHARATDTLGTTTPAGGYATATTTVDATGPTGGSIDYISGYHTGTSLAITLAAGTDTGAGLDAAGGTVQRAAATLSAGACGTFGPFAAVTLAAGADATVASGTCYRYRYVVSDNAGNSTTYASTGAAKVDRTPPTTTLALTAVTGGYLSGSTIYFNGSAAGGFTLVDTVGDAESGPASVTFPAVGATGWLHAAETVTITTGGAYHSAAFSWTANPSTPGTYTVTGRDAAGNAAATAVSLTNDSAAPAGGSIDYPDGYRTSPSVPVTTTAGTDAGAGLNQAGGAVQRAAATLSAGTCGAFGPFVTVTLAGGADTTAATGTCYRYRYLISDNVGNTATYASAAVVKVDTVAPTVTSIALANGGAAGTAESGDSLAIQFSEQLAAARFCSTWTGSGTQNLNGNNQVVVTITNAGGNDTLSVSASGCAFTLGTIALGADYVTATTTYAGTGSNKSSVSLTTSGQLTVTLGSPSAPVNLRVGVPAGTPTYTPVAGLADLAGNPLASTPFTGGSTRF
jgi:hypothetical protein